MLARVGDSDRPSNSSTQCNSEDGSTFLKLKIEDIKKSETTMYSLVNEEDLKVNLSFKGELAWIAKSELSENFKLSKNVSLEFEARQEFDRLRYQSDNLGGGGVGKLSVTKISDNVILNLTMPISIKAAQFLQSMSNFSMIFEISDQTYGSTQYLENYRIMHYSISERISISDDL